MIKKGFWVMVFFTALLVACVTTPISQRSAFILIPFAQEVSLGAQAYREILEKEKESNDEKLKIIINRVGRRIAKVSDMPDLEWEFKLIDSKQKNAFALPGGKVAFYTGILPVCANEAGVATVMGHEIAHAIARHGAQRISQQLVLTGLLSAASISLKDKKHHNIILGALGLGTTIGLTRPFSRMNELEADQIGLIYMAQAGYDPREAPRFWRRFGSIKKGKKIPAFLSTHPSDVNRIRQIQEFLPHALKEYEKAPLKNGLGESLARPFSQSEYNLANFHE